MIDGEDAQAIEQSEQKYRHQRHGVKREEYSVEHAKER
jgi:hypothetical protein